MIFNLCLCQGILLHCGFCTPEGEDLEGMSRTKFAGIIKGIKTRYIEKKVSLWLLGVQQSVISADFIKPETQQPIMVIILIWLLPTLLTF